MNTILNQTFPRFVLSPTVSLLALAAGVALGVHSHQSQQVWLLNLISSVEPLGVLWMNALRMVVIPLVVSTLVVAVLNLAKITTAGKIGMNSLLVLLAYLVAGGIFSGGVGYILIELFGPQAGIAQSLDLVASTTLDTADLPAGVLVGAGLEQLVPANPFASLAEGNLTQIIVFSLVFALALNSVSGPGRQTVEKFFEAFSQAMMKLVAWIMMAAPIGIFAMALSFSSQLGFGFAGIILNYLLLVCGLLGLSIAFMYPITLLFAKVSLRQFAGSVYPAQITAVSTRSSLASLPALLEGARNSPHLIPAVSNLVLPLTVAVFKTNRSISPLFGLMLLAHWYDIELGFVQLVFFFLTTMLLSLSSVGLPMGGGAALSLPLYLAAGIPVEGYVLMKSVEAIPDVLKTLVNVTADMSATTIINRFGA